MCKRRRHFLDTNIVDNHDIYTLLHEVSGITCVIERPRSSIEGLGLFKSIEELGIQVFYFW